VQIFAPRDFNLPTPHPPAKM